MSAMNRGTVTDVGCFVDNAHLAKYIGGKNTLITQGGGQRGIFTAGVLDAFLLANFDPFDSFYGTSAGALNLYPYLCRQRGLGKAFIQELTTHVDFFNLFAYIRRKQYLNLDWALDKICNYPYRLDIDLGKRALGQRRAYAAVTDADNLVDHYLPILKSEWRLPLIASCAIPTLVPQPTPYEGRQYVDGGVSASIPVQEAWRQGGRLLVVIRTEQTDTSVASNALTQSEQEWLRSDYSRFDHPVREKLSQLRGEWNQFLKRKFSFPDNGEKDILNGGRWLFGADNLYRLSYLLGRTTDPGIIDMLMVHFQTYSLTLEFLQNPPDDAFVVQIAPSQPLRSNSLMSKVEDLEADYQLGLKAGYYFVQSMQVANALCERPVSLNRSGLLATDK